MKAQREETWIPTGGDRHGRAPTQRRILIKKWAAEGYSSRQMAERLGMDDVSVRLIARQIDAEIPADTIIGRTKRHDSNRIVGETANALEGLAMGIELVSLDELDPDQAGDWVASLTESMQAINQFIKALKEATQ